MASSNYKKGNSHSIDNNYSMADDAVVFCDLCGNPIDSCSCVCPYCGEREGCTCCLFDAATGGG